MARWLGGSFFALLLLVGCQAGPRVAEQPAGPLPSYAELAERYNANIAALDRLAAATVTTLRWYDEKGDEHFDQGEGQLRFVRPGQVALTIGKLGNTMFWAGADADRYWLFDVREKIAYVGQHEHVGKPCSRSLPLEISPDAVPYLLGLVPLVAETPEGAAWAGRVAWYEGYYLIEPAGLPVRMLLDPATALPVRVDVLDAAGYSEVISELRNHRPVEVEGVAVGSRPRIATDAVLRAVAGRERMTLALSELSDGRRFEKIRSAQFDFDRLVRAHAPKEVVVLDAACE